MGAQKLHGIIRQDGRETLAAVDRFTFHFEAGRVTGDTSLTVQLKAVYPDGVRAPDISVAIKEAIPEPRVTLTVPADWDGRKTLELLPAIGNRKELEEHDAADLNTTWDVSGRAVIQDVAPGQRVLKRSQNCGQLTVTAKVCNGGEPSVATATMM